VRSSSSPTRYPLGGIMSDHVIVLWNWRRHGYLASLHFESARARGDYTMQERVTAALAIARSYALVQP
jgi:hypothetical protein